MTFFKKQGPGEERNGASGVVATDVPSQLKRILDQLGFLEKKLDTLMAQSGARRPFSPGFRGGSGGSGGSGGNRNFAGRRPYNQDQSRPGFRSHPQTRPFHKRSAPTNAHPRPE